MNTRKVLGVAITLLGVGACLYAYGAYDMWSWNEYVEYCTGDKRGEAPDLSCVVPEGGFPWEASIREAAFMQLTFIGSLFLVAGGVILIVLKKRY